jgi:hypothetical protein
VTITEVVLSILVLLAIALTKPFLILPYLIYQAFILFCFAALCVLLLVFMPIFIFATIFLAEYKSGQMLAFNGVLLVISGVNLALFTFLFMCFFRCCQLVEMEQKILRESWGSSISYHQLLDPAIGASP